MLTLLAIVFAGLVGAGLLLTISAVVSPSRSIADPVDAADAEHWLVVRAARVPALRRALAHADRRVIGGAAVAVSFVAVFVAALAVGWLFTSIDSSRGFARWDRSIADWGPENATSAIADVMRTITRLGATIVLLTAMVVVGLVARLRTGNFGSLWFLLTVGVGITLVNNGLKLAIIRDRPPVEHLVGSAGSSFPSGHSAAAAACWMAIALVVGRWVPRRVRPWLGVAAATIAGLVAASRALLGVHWLTDVVAGLVVGFTWFFVVAIVFGGRSQRLGAPVEHVAAEPAGGALVRTSSGGNGTRHDV